jgi:hypothetical protein
MGPSRHYTGPEVVTLLDSPTLITHLPLGGVQYDKAGITGLGATTLDAKMDWSDKFAMMLRLPKG